MTRGILIAVAVAFLGFFLFLPLAAVGVQALDEGVGAYARAVAEPEARRALWLTVIVAAFALPCNLLFGLAAAWATTRFHFPGRRLVITLIDLPVAVSPVISGMVWVLIFGTAGWAGDWLAAHGIRVIFAVPGIILATLFVTAPYVARELIPLMQAQGAEEEEAAVSLGARGGQLFWRVTLPKIGWGVLYGAILMNARAIGEFGAVSVVSGHIRGQTTTAPLHVEVLYNEYNFVAAFSVASVLCGFALVTLAAKAVVEWKARSAIREAQGIPA